jgi:hypothetical protein
MNLQKPGMLYKDRAANGGTVTAEHAALFDSWIAIP